jgi:hypothetical protein
MFIGAHINKYFYGLLIVPKQKTKPFKITTPYLKSEKPDLNWRSQVPKTCALPTKLFSEDRSDK